MPQVVLGMPAFRENVERREAVNMPDDPRMPPLEWARTKVGSARVCVCVCKAKNALQASCSFAGFIDYSFVPP